ncbi:hypothetical protein BY996DRAFT_8289371 [Phakopsora pachyrhizi]|nr:hypothetical protein BY996DRAFT_8289371 [Phakopsora pachyrhizi]
MIFQLMIISLIFLTLLQNSKVHQFDKRIFKQTSKPPNSRGLRLVILLIPPPKCQGSRVPSQTLADSRGGIEDLHFVTGIIAHASKGTPPHA